MEEPEGWGLIWEQGSRYIGVGFCDYSRSFLAVDNHSGPRESQEQRQDGGKAHSIDLTSGRTGEFCEPGSNQR